VSENPKAHLVAQQINQFWSTAIQSAARLLKENEPVKEWADGESRDRYYSHAPYMASQILSQMQGAANWMVGVSDRDFETSMDSANAVLREMRQLNAKAAKEL
jgi:hypothetical protein